SRRKHDVPADRRRLGPPVALVAHERSRIQPRNGARAARCQWGREDSNLRRLSQRVYSPSPLANREHPREQANCSRASFRRRVGLRPTWPRPLAVSSSAKSHHGAAGAGLFAVEVVPLATRERPASRRIVASTSWSASTSRWWEPGRPARRLLTVSRARTRASY